MKLNLGCGHDYKYGWVNVDKFMDVHPDLVFDLETFPWPLEDNVADEILLSHVLEQVGRSSHALQSVMKELYRIAKPGAHIEIRAINPRHDDFLADPTHLQPIIPSMFQAFDLAMNENWQAEKLPGTPLGKHLKIDFSVVEVQSWLGGEWVNKINSGKMSREEAEYAVKTFNNVVDWSKIILRANKPFSPGKSLKAYDALVIQRLGGMGDVVMVLSAIAALKKVVGIPIILLTSPDYVELSRQSPHVDAVVTNAIDADQYCAARGLVNLKFCDWGHVQFGLSRFHEVDAFLLDLGLTLPDTLKGAVLRPLSLDHTRYILDLLQPLGDARGKWVVVHPGVTDPHRSWPEASWRLLVGWLKEQGCKVIAIGKRYAADGKSALSLADLVDLDLSRQLSLLDTVELLRHCDVFISADSGPIQLAGATNIGIVGIYSVVDGRNRLPYRHGSITYRAIPVAPDCELAPCFPQINDEEKLRAFCERTGANETDRPRILETWCLHPQTYQCMQSGQTLARVKESVKALLGLP